MMTGRLIISYRDEEGAIGRIVGLVERRGFELRGLTMTGEGTGHKLTVDVAARDSSRCSVTASKTRMRAYFRRARSPMVRFPIA